MNDRRMSADAQSGVDTIVIGAGHAGLAMSRCLSDRGIEHVVLERGAIANSWKYERWDSLRLLTPNWQSRLPGFQYVRAFDNVDADDFMSMPQLISFIESYAAVSRAPVVTNTEVKSVQKLNDGYVLQTSRGPWRCRALVIASGACNLPAVPSVAAALPKDITVLSQYNYRNPQQLPEGGVLVVGASATGIQLASEIQRSGRPVTLCVGEHVRMPRTYRGRDIQWWMEATGILDEKYDAVDDLTRARNVPSPQLVGSANRTTLDLNTLEDIGVRCVGRLSALRDGVALFSGALRNHCTMADLKVSRLLTRFDKWAMEVDIADDLEAVECFEPTRLSSAPLLQQDLMRGDIRSVVWATGYRPDYSWLNVPVLDRKGRLRHEGGVVDAPGLYAMGLTFMRRRKSTFIHGAEDDARDLSAHINQYLDRTARRWVSGYRNEHSQAVPMTA